MKRAVQVIGAIALIAAALVGSRVLQDARTSVAGAPGTPPVPSGRPTPPVDPRDQPPPSGAALPSQAPYWQARTAVEVAANLVGDPFAAQQLQDITRPGSPIYDPSVSGPARLGEPIFVKAFTKQYPDIWLTPIMSGPRPVAVLAASVRSGGTATADFYTGFSGVFPHALTRADAIAAATAGTDVGVSAELMWSKLGELQGYPTGLAHPFWRVLRASGAEVLVLTDRTVVTPDQLR